MTPREDAMGERAQEKIGKETNQNYITDKNQRPAKQQLIHPLLRLQQTIGNRALQGLLQRADTPGDNTSSANILLTPDEGEKVIIAGEAWIGTPYQYGGNSREGIDCSHFVYNAYLDAGFSYEYLSTSTFPSSPHFEKVETPQAGDVVLFNGHMGIYNPHPSEAGKTILNAGSKGVGYGRPSWYGTIVGYYRYKKPKPKTETQSNPVINKKQASETPGRVYQIQTQPDVIRRDPEEETENPATIKTKSGEFTAEDIEVFA
jgi:cell wall-associated NlpC family hydrolase